MNPIRIWILIHIHREGVTPYLFSAEDTAEQLNADIFDIAVTLECNYEEGDERESLNIAGPYSLGEIVDLPKIERA